MIRIRAGLLLLPLVLAGLATHGGSTPTASPGLTTHVLTVGPSGQYRTLGAAVGAADRHANAGDYYQIEVAPGTYTNDFADVTRPMTIEANPRDGGGRVLLLDTVNLPNEKAIILTTASLTVDGLTFEGAHIPDRLGGNGAGIRDQNAGQSARLIVENSTFSGNQEGILQGNDFREHVQILNSTFEDNGNPNPAVFQHAVYIDAAASLVVDHSLFCGQLIGHDVKSRALATTVENSQIFDGAADPAAHCRAGSTSYGIDAPNGGMLTVLADRIVQGPGTQNDIMVDYGAEGMRYPDNGIHVSGTTFTNSAIHATGIYDPPCVLVDLAGNTFKGVATPVHPARCAG